MEKMKSDVSIPIGHTNMTLSEEECDLISKALLVYIRDLSDASKAAYDRSVAERCDELMGRCASLNSKFCQISSEVWPE